MANRLFVGNLPYNTTEDEVREHFSQAGNVESVNIVTDRQTGRSRGFAFVDMSTEEEASNAISTLNGVEFDGRALVVNEAREREERPQGGGRF